MGDFNDYRFGPPLASFNNLSSNGVPHRSQTAMSFPTYGNREPYSQYFQHGQDSVSAQTFVNQSMAPLNLHNCSPQEMLRCQQDLQETVRLRKRLMQALEEKQEFEFKEIHSKFEQTIDLLRGTEKVHDFITQIDEHEEAQNDKEQNKETIATRRNSLSGEDISPIDPDRAYSSLSAILNKPGTAEDSKEDVNELSLQGKDGNEERSFSELSDKLSDPDIVEPESNGTPRATVYTESGWNRLSNNVKNEAIDVALDFLDFGSDSDGMDMKEVDNLAELRKKRLAYIQAKDVPEKQTLKGTARAIQFIFRIRNARNATRKQKSSTSQQNLKEVYELYLAMAIAWTVKIIEIPVRSLMKIQKLDTGETKIVIRNTMFSYWNRNSKKKKENKKIANARRVMKVHFLEVLNELEKAIEKKQLPTAILMFVKSSLLVTESNLSEYLFDSEKERLNIDEFDLLLDLNEEQKMMLLAGFWVNRVIISALAKRSSSLNITVLQSYFHRIAREFSKRILEEEELKPRDEEILQKIGTKLLADESPLFTDADLLAACSDELERIIRIILMEINELSLRKEPLKDK